MRATAMGMEPAVDLPRRMARVAREGRARADDLPDVAGLAELEGGDRRAARALDHYVEDDAAAWAVPVVDALPVVWPRRRAP